MNGLQQASWLYSLLEEADMVTYWRIWVVPREFNLVPETIVLGMGFFGFSGAVITRFGIA
ncbi:hypothetical protein BK131_07185 [Paenibacillus amylolyticus]|uniref:Uncharacterized protein n=1 Tax=Paenibacillus amylolyticus TaxID=1451 RepID=A0A1R1C6T2_PAEAM|nr:hypothetical protein BK131_07185 [Paenibacillus amylolyticus]